MILSGIKFPLLCLSLALSLSSFSQELVRPVVYGAPFLGIVTDARSGAMGETGVATTGDVFSQFHNSSKYLFLDDETKGLGISYVPQYVGYANDIFLANAVYYHQLDDRSALSGSLTYSSFGKMEMEEKIGSQFVHLGSFYPNEFAVDLSYGLRFNEYFGMAVTGRYIRSDISDNRMNPSLELKSANAIAADISGFYSSAFDLEKYIWTFGFSLKNVGSKLEYSSETGYELPLPTSLKIGGGYQISTGENDQISIYLEALKFLVPSIDDQGNLSNQKALTGIFNSFGDATGGVSEELKEIIFNLGGEYDFNEIFKFRMGYIYQNQGKGSNNHLTFGTGIQWERFLFDFAYQAPLIGNDLVKRSNVLRASISLDLGPQ